MDAIHNTPETTHTSLWADVRNYIERKGRLAWDRAPPIAICSICQVTELDILGLPPSEEAVASIEPAMITICGHMACYICLETWYQSCYDEGRQVTCPICRHVLEFNPIKCGHTILGFLIPTNEEILSYPNSTSYLKDVPRTLPEGGTQPDACHGCRRLHIGSRALVSARRFRNLFAERFAEETAKIMGVDFTIGLLIAVNKSTVEDARVRENYEHPSWGAQWDSEEAVLPSDVE